MKRRDFLKAAGVGVGLATLPIATLPIAVIPFAAKASAKPALRPGIAVLQNYSAGHDRSILVSGGNWKIGDLICLNDVVYTVIEEEHGWHAITPRGEIIWYPTQEFEAQRLFLDRPLEQACPEGTEATRPKVPNFSMPGDYCTGDRHRHWLVEKWNGKEWAWVESYEFKMHQPLEVVLRRHKHQFNIRIRSVTLAESVQIRNHVASFPIVS